jgi:8-oxo-dGTP pyrophosphatase MutT (NUDIX family)
MWRDHVESFVVQGVALVSGSTCATSLTSFFFECLLVKGWKSSSSWSFPRGKINADEPDFECAAREALEETGYDVSDRIIKEAVIRVTVKEQISTMFVIPNVPEDTAFAPRTRKEISVGRVQSWSWPKADGDTSFPRKSSGFL